nr:hypothetical protein [Kibdelosporangium sp. MJ126-NF4]CTQ90539.1 hypothetical protein [Kibdelosporangium sp. MJ126-NF4]
MDIGIGTYLLGAVVILAVLLAVFGVISGAKPVPATSGAGTESGRE